MYLQGFFSSEDSQDLLRVAKYNPEFLKSVQGKKFRNRETGNDNVFDSLPEDQKQELYQAWASSQTSTPEQEAQKRQQEALQKALQSNVLVPNKNPNRYQGVKVEYGSLLEEDEDVKQELYGLTSITAKKLGVTPEQFVTDLAGGGGLQGSLKEVKITVLENRVMVSGSGDNIVDMHRVITFDKQGVPISILNKHLELEPSAPKGTGTKMLATQVASLKEAGGKKIRTTGAGCDDCDYVGYYVWPLLGFEGEIPEDDVGQMPRWLIEELIDTGGEGPPFYISELMSFEEGREWWKENGGEIELEFDVRNDEVLQEYVKRKAVRDRKTVGQFLHQASTKETSKNKKKADKAEQAPRLDPQDLKLLFQIWNEKARERKRPMSEKKLARELLKYAQEEPSFRKALFREIRKESDFVQNVRDFTVGPFSQRQMLMNLQAGDIVEMVYETGENEPSVSVTRLVRKPFDESVSGVELQGVGDQNELLVDQGAEQPLLWEPGPRKEAFLVLKLRLVKSALRS